MSNAVAHMSPKCYYEDLRTRRIVEICNLENAAREEIFTEFGQLAGQLKNKKAHIALTQQYGLAVEGGLEPPRGG